MKQHNSIQNKLRKTLALALTSLALLPTLQSDVYAGETNAQANTGTETKSYECGMDSYDTWIQNRDLEMLMFPNVKEHIDEITNLTEEEKKTLLATEDELESIYEKIKKLREEVKSISEKIYGEETKTHNIPENEWNKNNELWSKFLESLSEKDLATDDFRALIQASNLTEEEKKLLLADEEASMKERAAMEVLEMKVKEATKSQETEIEKLFEEVEAIFEKNKALYDKVFSSEGFNHASLYSEDMGTKEMDSKENMNKKGN